MHTTAYLIGVVVGALCGLVLAVLLFRMLKKRYRVDVHEFDERQILARGRAYKYGFIATLVLVFAERLVREIGFVLFDSIQGAAALCLIGLFVFVTSCIWQEAYLTLHETPKMTYVLLALGGGLNLISAAIAWVQKQPLLQDGRLYSGSLSLMVAVFVFAVLAVFALKQWAVRWEESEE